MKNVFITGGTGFVGSHVTSRLLDLGWAVTITGRTQTSPFTGRKGFEQIICDTTVKGPWQEKIADMDVVINLAGKNIFTLWNDTKKLEIEESRILTTSNLVEAMEDGSPKVLLSTSASGFYGNRDNEILTEESSKGDGFLSDLCDLWENEARVAEARKIRTVMMRFGMILGTDGGALSMMRTPFKLGLGGNLGSGEQWTSWMHIDDLVSAIVFLIDCDDAQGPVNFCSPHAVRNKDFTRALGRALNRPTFFHIPGFVLRIVMGELGENLLSSQRMAAEKLLRLGFQFSYPDIDSAVQNLTA